MVFSISIDSSLTNFAKFILYDAQQAAFASAFSLVRQ